jgi:hypothetical protein
MEKVIIEGCMQEGHRGRKDMSYELGEPEEKEICYYKRKTHKWVLNSLVVSWHRGGQNANSECH